MGPVCFKGQHNSENDNDSIEQFDQFMKKRGGTQSQDELLAKELTSSISLMRLSNSGKKGGNQNKKGSQENYKDQSHFPKLIGNNAIEVIQINDDGQIENPQSEKLKDFKFIKIIGRGAFGKVWLVQKIDNNQYYAMKIIKKMDAHKNNQRVYMKNEKEIMQNLTCPFIVQLHFAFQSPSKLYMVMDFMIGGELFFHLKKKEKFSESETRFYASEIIICLDYLHNRGIIYRDLKPENILLGRDGHIKLTDFGLSKVGVKDNEQYYTMCGTAEYMAPEIHQGLGHGKEVDFYSLGCLIYEMLTGYAPFQNENQQKMLRDRLNNQNQIPYPPEISQEAKSLISGLLQIEPNKRLKCREIQNHQFFYSTDWQMVFSKQIEPPFIPIVGEDDDIQNFDKIFTNEQIKETPAEQLKNDNYDQFTYMPTNLFKFSPPQKQL